MLPRRAAPSGRWADGEVGPVEAGARDVEAAGAAAAVLEVGAAVAFGDDLLLFLLGDAAGFTAIARTGCGPPASRWFRPARDGGGRTRPPVQRGAIGRTARAGSSGRFLR
ncbi:hypothetical protein GCM10009663_62990 [Kitasatospora arboriphila]|uniref:Uncharacterized protein n=1 Tax=Kitasatospora arboriphila TaxID=258052 RepID=A0ABP4ER17_9ACTN